MKNIFALAVFMTAVAISPIVGNAATLITSTQYALGSTCDTDSAASGAIVSSCGSFIAGDGIDARASYGDIGIRTQVDGPTAVIGGSVEAYDFWRGSAAFNDTLSFSVDSGTIRLFTDIAATLIETVTGGFGGSSFPAGRNVFSINVGSTTIFQRYHEYQNVNPTGLADLVYTDDIGMTGTGFVDLTFTGGSLDLSVDMYSEATCGAQHSGSFGNKIGTCLLGVDAYNSMRLIGATVFDSSGLEIAGGLLGSASGFDYLYKNGNHLTVAAR